MSAEQNTLERSALEQFEERVDEGLLRADCTRVFVWGCSDGGRIRLACHELWTASPERRDDVNSASVLRIGRLVTSAQFALTTMEYYVP